MTHKRSDYMHWAKTSSAARFNLATSGVGHFPLRELPFDCSNLEINGSNSYGYRPLVEAIARKYAVDPDCVVEAAGTSMANHLAMATLIEPGDEVLLEQPAYGPLIDTLLYLRADVKRFVRPPENGFQVDPAAIRLAVTPKTRLIVITNLHNPSSALTPEKVLMEIGDIGPNVLVDEVYLDAVYENTPRSSVHLGKQFVVTNSLTKIYGLSGLRCGWILAHPDLAWKMKHLNNVFGATPPHPPEILAAAAFDHLDAIRVRARRKVEADRKVLAAFLQKQQTEWGTTAFIRLPVPVDPFLDRLRTEYETSAVPGRFFETPDHIRIGMGVDSDMFAEGMRRLSALLSATEPRP